MRVVHTIQTPWAPYALTFSRDGTRLAIGGGTWYGGGGIMLVDGRTLQPVSDAVLDLGQPTVSGVCFASDDSHVIAATWQSSQRSGPVLVHELQNLPRQQKPEIGMRVTAVFKAKREREASIRDLLGFEPEEE